MYYGGGWKFCLCEKSPLINDTGEVIDLISHSTDVTNFNLIDISKFMLDSKKNNLNPNKQFSYRLEEREFNCYLLSNRQIEFLFFLLRGKTDKETAKIFKLSPRTVEGYVQEIKFKMQCLNRREIIEKSFREGLFNVLPKSFLNRCEIGIRELH